MQFLFILDPLASLKSEKDTSLAIMREAAARGHQLYCCQQHDILLRNGCIKFAVKRFTFNQDGCFKSDSPEEVIARTFDAIIMRKDPPFDNEYLYSTYLLEMASQQGTRVFNNPASIRSWNEKLSVARFAQFAPEFLVTSDADLIRDFLSHYQDIIIKPLDGMGGSGIFRLTESDYNIGVILETATQFGQQTIMAQRYLPAILQGDKRIIVINGVPLPYALARIPKAGETRGNLAAGGKGVAQLLSPKDLEIATTVGITLKKEGLFLVGLDVIGDYLTEINVTSPTGMVEIAAQTQHTTLPCNPAQVFMQALEKSCVG